MMPVTVLNKEINNKCTSIQMKNITKEEFEDTKGVIRIRISTKDRQHNGQKKKEQCSTKHCTNPLKPWDECALEE
jgi:hypothetical protein